MTTKPRKQMKDAVLELNFNSTRTLAISANVDGGIKRELGSISTG
jgi:hypothetical protein